MLHGVSGSNALELYRFHNLKRRLCPCALPTGEFPQLLPYLRKPRRPRTKAPYGNCHRDCHRTGMERHLDLIKYCGPNCGPKTQYSKKNNEINKLWRKGWDSNPRYPCRYAGFQDRCLKPLGHPSVLLVQWSKQSTVARPTGLRSRVTPLPRICPNRDRSRDGQKGKWNQLFTTTPASGSRNRRHRVS